ncbi:MAG: beta-phosphoglucomutase [Eubacteriales bacterium]|nr:beta-phosphoglucomutase [Eubacteriales bacterium]
MKAVIFDLDGVLVSTDDYHYQAWKQMADEEKIYFDRTINERLRGVSRMASLEIILEKSTKEYSPDDKNTLAERKNAYYVEKIQSITANDILPGSMETIRALKTKNIKIAVGSSSKNAPLILKRLGIDELFDAVVDGNQITHSKPNPEVFVKCAEKMNIEPSECLVVEDAQSGIEAGYNAGMKTLAVGSAQESPLADYRADSLKDIDLANIVA